MTDLGGGYRVVYSTRPFELEAEERKPLGEDQGTWERPVRIRAIRSNADGKWKIA